MTDDEKNLHEIAEQLSGVIDALLDALEEAVASVFDSLESQGLQPYADPSLFSHLVRHLVREKMKALFPDLDQESNPNMSPVHLVNLGPHEVRMLHALDGTLPKAQTKVRAEWFEHNDKGIVAFNVFPPNDLVAIDENAESVAEAHIVVLWESAGPDLTEVKLCRPSMADWPGPSIDLLAASVAEDDLTFEPKPDEEAEDGTATGDDTPD